MLDKNTLAQLTELKTAIVASKEYGEGKVVGSSGRFGFVRLDDGRDAFLNPEKMQKVLPGDRVKVSLTKNEKDQYEASFEKILEQGIKRFVGIYKSKGKAQFVLPDVPQFGRWIFIPPQQRQNCRENDYVVAELTKHPYSDGKASAKIVARLGPADEPFIEHKLVIAKHGLYRYWPKDCLNQASKLSSTALNLDEREDRTDLPFVTIDAETTKDMDDAVHVVANDSGWTLNIAIADPASFILPGSRISKSARDYAQTVYLPGETLPMLPEQLATEVFSLKEKEVKPALLCTIELTSDGTVSDYNFRLAKIQSRSKLCYDSVANLIDNETPLPQDIEDKEAVTNSLIALSKLAATRRERRDIDHLVSEDQTQYSYELSDTGKITSIKAQSRNSAHKMIEEAMLLINTCAGQFLSENNTGIHTVHEGFRAERMGEVNALLKEEFDGQPPENLDTFDGYVKFIQALKNNTEKKHLLAPLKRMMRSSVLSTTAGPHMSMGFKHYAAISSPIRRYGDLSNHWAIHQILNKQKITSLQSKTLDKLNETIDAGRQACRELEQWLKCQFTASKVGETYTGTIRIVTQQGFGVRVEENGIEGFVQFPKGQEKSYDAKRMKITVGDTCYRLEDEVEIKVAGVDLDKRRAQFELA